MIVVLRMEYTNTVDRITGKKRGESEKSNE